MRRFEPLALHHMTQRASEAQVLDVPERMQRTNFLIARSRHSRALAITVAILPATLLHFATLWFRYVRVEEICDSLRRKVSTCHEHI